jgi:hypothetical protein
MKSLKSQNNKYIWAFIFLNTLLFFVVFFNYDFTIATIRNIIDDFSIKNGLLIFLSPLVSIVFNGLLTSNQKSIIVFGKIKHPLPSERVFTNLIYSDKRLDIKLLKDKFGDFPNDPVEQSQLWYKIYKKNQNEIIVLDSHRVFLLTRDLCSLAFIFLILFSIVILFSGSSFKLLFIGYMILQFLLLWLSSRNYGNKFTLNVLAEEMK